MTFEFDLEVRPQFDLPQWKGLQIEKPVREFTDADVDQALKRILTNRGSLVPFDGPAEPGDYITTNLTFKHGETGPFQRRRKKSFGFARCSASATARSRVSTRRWPASAPARPAS